MINEKKLIEEIKSKRINIAGLRCGKTWTAEFVEMYNQIINEILKIINEQPKVNELIPVEKELPKENGEYLVYYSCESDGSVGEDKECGYSVEYFDTEMESFGYWQNILDSRTLGFVDSEFIEMHTAIAWMPLP